MENDSLTPLEDLADLIAGPARYGLDSLVRDLDIERQRLGVKPYLTAFWISDLGYDGFTDWIRLGASYTDVDEAIIRADQWVDSIKNQYLKEARADWVVDPDDGLSPTVPVGKGVDIHYRNSLGLAGGAYNHIYLCARVLGPFQGWIVDRPLVDFFAKTKDELRSYLLDVGGSRPGSA